jgi:hypothetical protein
MGNNFESWGSNPTYIDGFASSRNLLAMTQKLEPIIVENHTRDRLTTSNNWRTVGKIVSMNLIKESAVLVKYALPVVQESNPNSDSIPWRQLSSLKARLLVDQLPYEYSSVNIEAIKTSSLYSEIALILNAGTHTIELQWFSSDNKWMTISDFNLEYSHNDILVMITSENAKPSLVGPASITGLESTPTSINGLSIDDIDAKLSPGIFME